MTRTMKMLAAAALLGALSGCANWTPNWSANSPADGMHSPPIYETSPSD
jgi:hypothetical protein